MDVLTYSYIPTKPELNIAMMEYLFEKMQKDDQETNAVYNMLIGMLNNAALDTDFHRWYKMKMDAAIMQCVKWK